MPIIKPFHIQLSTALQLGHINCEKAAQILSIKTKYTVTGRSMRMYATGEMVPDFLKAKAILNCFGYKTDDSALQYALEMSKAERHIRQNDKYKADSIRKTVRIKFRNMIDGLSVEEINDLMIERLNKLYGTEDAMSNYINYLIKEDLEKFLIEKGVKNNGTK